jgi:uncharacterized protein with gpF-like domain
MPGLPEALAAIDQLEEAVTSSASQRERRALERKLERAMAKAWRAQAKAFLRELAKERGSYPVTEAAGRWGDWQNAFQRAVDKTLQLFTGPIDSATTTSLLRGAKRLIATVKGGIAFDLKNTRAQAYLKANPAAAKVAGINDTTREAIAGLVEKAVTNGTSYDDLAKQITQRFEDFSAPRPHEHARTRAQLVAIQEVGQAYVDGAKMAGQELADAGVDLEKHWSSVGDAKVDPDICAPNDAQGWIPFDEDFQSGHSAPLGHVGCRCDLMVRRARTK